MCADCAYVRYDSQHEHPCQVSALRLFNSGDGTDAFKQRTATFGFDQIIYEQDENSRDDSYSGDTERNLVLFGLDSNQRKAEQRKDYERCKISRGHGIVRQRPVEIVEVRP